MRKSFIVLFAILLFVSVAWSQVPQMFNYQAVVRDAGGNVIANTQVDINILIREGSPSGTVVFDELHSPTTNDFGLVNLQVGSIETAQFTSINWSVNVYFIELVVNGTSVGTQQLLSVPYALHSNTSDFSYSADYNSLYNLPDFTGWDQNQWDDFSGNYNDLTGVPTNVSTFNNDAGYITNPDDADSDPANELQVLSVSNDTLFLSNGGFVSLSEYSDTLWRMTGADIHNTNSGKVGIGTSTPPGKLVVQGDSSLADTVPLFEVKDRTGHTVFVVYSDSAHFYLGDDSSKTNKGAFAVSGRNTAKSFTHDFLKVTPDYSRIYTGDPLLGFGVENIGVSANESYMRLTPENYFIGHEAGLNTFPGPGLLGRYNIFLGYMSGRSNINGHSNVFLGYNTGYNNLAGNWNVFLGYEAGYSNITGGYNVATGYEALRNNTIGESNVANGFRAMFYNTDGMDNVAFGHCALHNNTTGNSNVAVGAYALFGNTTALNNVALGCAALQYNTGTYNTASGNYALQYNLSGDYNTANGTLSLNNNTTGAQNTAMGALSLTNNTKGMFNTAIGYATQMVGDSGQLNTSLGYLAGMGASGVNFFQCTSIGANSFLINSRTNVTLLGYGIGDVLCTGDNQILLGNTAITEIRAMVIGITAYSDKRFKLNVSDDVAGLDFIMKLKPVTYNENPEILHRIWGTPDSLLALIDHSEIKNQRFIGFLAQDVENAAKESGFDFPGIDIPRNDKEVYSLRYTDFIMPMVKGIQELNEKNQELQEVIEKQNLVIDQLNKRIEKLESK